MCSPRLGRYQTAIFAASGTPARVGEEDPDTGSGVSPHVTVTVEVTHSNAGREAGAAGVCGIGKSTLVKCAVDDGTGGKRLASVRPARSSVIRSSGRSRGGVAIRRRTNAVPAGTSRPGTHSGARAWVRVVKLTSSTLFVPVS